MFLMIILLINYKMKKVYLLHLIILLLVTRATGQEVLNQSFDDGYPPTGWMHQKDDGNTRGWQQLSTSKNSIKTPHSGAKFVEFESYYTKKNLGATLTSPMITETLDKGYILEFYSVVTKKSGGLHVDFSSTNGAIWTEDILVVPATADETEWTKHTVDLSDYLPKKNIKIRFRSTSTCSYGICSIALDDVRIYKPAPMTFGSVTTEQNKTNAVSLGATDQEIIAVKVNCTGALNAFDATKFVFNTAGSTSSSDISKAKLYYTGTKSAFSAENKFAEIDNPNGEFTLTGTQKLAEGDNYFWLAYDISSSATIGNSVDAQCTSVTVDGNDKTPDVTNPDGNRLIKNFYILESGTNSKKVTSNLIFLDHGGDEDYTKSFTGVITFEPKDGDNKVQVNFTEFDVYRYHSLIVYNGNSTTAPKLGEYKGTTLPGLIKSTAADGCLTFKFSVTSYASTFGSGWIADVSNYKPAPMTYISSDVFQDNVNTVSPGDKKNELLGFNVKTNGLISPLSLQQVKLSLAGTTDVNDIEKLVLYYGKDKKSFSSSANVKLKEITTITSDITVDITTTLISGDNYFWIAADIKSTAKQNNMIDAAVQKITVTGSEYTPDNSSPDGARKVVRVYKMSTYKEITTSGGMFYDDGGAGYNYDDSFEGSVIFKPQTPENKIKIKFNSFDTESNDGCTYDYMIIYNGPDPSSPEIGRYCGTTTPPDVVSTAADGSICVYFHSDNGTNAAGWEAVISEHTPAPMAITGSESVAVTSGGITKGSVAAAVAGLKVTTDGGLNPLTVEKLKVDTRSTANINKIRIYYTGRIPEFSRDNLVGEAAYASAVQEIITDRALVTGDNYFWIAYDVSPDAVADNLLKAECVDYTADAVKYNNTATNPAGIKVTDNIKMPLTMGNTIVIKDDIVFTDDGGKENNYSKSGKGSVIFEPADPTKKVKVTFSEFEMPTRYGADFIVYNGKATDGSNTIATLFGENVPAPVKSTSDDGAVRFYFKPNSMYTAKKGWVANVSLYEPRQLFVENSVTTQPVRTFLQPNTEDQLILGVQLMVAGEKGDLDIKKMTFSTEGCTNSTDISKAKLYYTNSLDKFSTAEKLAEVDSPNGDFTFDFDKKISSEKGYYFWLCFDIANDAKVNDIVDARFKSVTAGGVKTDAANGNPVGKRVVRGALKGEYTINNAANVDADFVDPAEAVNALNTLGVTGAVTFKIADGEYKGALAVNSITGVNNTNRVVFEAASGNSDNVIFSYSGKNVAPTLLTIKGADYLTFKNITFKATGLTYGRLVEYYGEANNNSFINNKFIGIECNTSDYDNNKTLVYCGQTGDDKTLDHNATFEGNTFENGNTGLYIMGINYVTDFETGLTVKNNVFKNQYAMSVYLNYQNDVLIDGNSFIIEDAKKQNWSVRIFKNKKNARIVNNKFNLNLSSKGGSAIMLQGFESVEGSRALVANNMIYATSTSSAVGISLEDAKSVDIVHNTIKIDGSGKYSKAFFFDKRGASPVFDDVNIKNNIFAVYSGSYVIWSKMQATNSSISHNNYYTNDNSERMFKYGDVTVTSLDDWKAAVTSDKQSISVAPQFVSEKDLHVTGTGMKFGTQIKRVTDDIDGDMRNAATPYIGADEIPDATFAGGYPKFSDITATSAKMLLKSTVAGTVYYILLPESAELPTVDQIKAGTNSSGDAAIASGNIAVKVDEEKPVDITSLTEKTNYSMVLVVDKGGDQYSSVMRLILSTLDVTSPDFINSTPILEDITDNSFTVKAEISEPGTIYYALCDKAIQLTSSADVKNGVTSVISGKINAAKENYIKVNGLNPGTEYNLYVVAEDAEETPNLQATPVKLDLKTLYGNAITNFVAEAIEGTRVNLTWTQSAKPANVMIVCSEDKNFEIPVNGTAYNVDDKIGEAEVIYKGTDNSFNHTTVDAGKTYYYRAYSFNASNEYSQYAEDFAVLKYAEWTILVYLDGDNNLEGNAIKDVNEMEAVDLPENVNVIVQLDRNPGYNYSNGNWTDTRRYKIKHDTDTKNIGSERLDADNPLGELNMGDPANLSDFIQWGQKSYPAKKTMLIMWDHGGGWRSEDATNFGVTKGVCWDDSNGNDYLEMREVESAMKDAKAKSKKSISVLGFDVCLAAMTEVAYQVKDEVDDYFIFSQALEPGDGWSYNTWLQSLVTDPATSPLDLSKAAVTTYKDSYEGSSTVTLSVMDAKKIGGLRTAIDEFVAQYSAVSVEPAVINAAFDNADLFSARKNYIDLGLFMDHCSKYLANDDTKAKATAVLNTLDDAIEITGNTGVYNKAKGLNIYFHKYNDLEWDDYKAPYCDFADESNWKSFVINYDKDGLAPMFIDGFPKALNLSATMFDLAVKANKTGKAYYVVLADGASVPTSAQVKEGKNADNSVVAVNRKGEFDVTRYELTKKSVQNLEGSTEYDIYIVLEDSKGVLMDNPVKFEVETLNRRVATFESLTLANNAFWNGSDNSGGFENGGFYFPNYYSSVAWSGFAYSNRTDNSVAGIPGQYTAYAGKGVEDSDNYGVAYVFGSLLRANIQDAADGTTVSGMYVTNNNFAYHSMKNGDAIAKKFGGTSGNDPDWFKLTVIGINSLGHQTGEVEFYLADFRFDDNSKDYIVDDWKWVDLTSLGDIAKIEFRLSSSDGGSGAGMNTPGYFCFDNLNAKAPEDHAPVVKKPVDKIVVDKNAADKVIYLNDVFSDEDGDKMIFEVVSNSNESVVTATINNADLKLDFVHNATGDASVVVKATANGKSVQTTVEITVNNVDNAPVVANPVADIVVEQGADDKVIDLSKVFSDPDGDAITYAVKSNNNKDLVTPAISDNTLTIDFADAKTGDAVVIITATANGKSVDATINITVNKADQAPVVKKAFADITVKQNAADKIVDLNSVFSDPDGDVITYTVESNSNESLVSTTVNNNELTISFAPNNTGDAVVVVKATANGKSVSSSVAIKVEAATSVDNISDSGIVVYPNPCTTMLNIRSESSIIREVKVLNISGNVVISVAPNTEVVQLGTENLVKGIYIISIKTDDKIYTKRIIKQ
jgi:hypothetical protein